MLCLGGLQGRGSTVKLDHGYQSIHPSPADTTFLPMGPPTLPVRNLTSSPVRLPESRQRRANTFHSD